MKKNLAATAALAVLALAGCTGTEPGKLVITNPLAQERVNEVVELPLQEVCQRLKCSSTDPLMVVDGQGRELPTQVTYDSLLLFPATVEANASATYYVRRGVSSDTVRMVQGRYHPERADDIVWENDRAGFRTYGPGITGVYGYDVFLKRVSRPILDSLYAINTDPVTWKKVNDLRKAGRRQEADSLQRSFSFHIDHGVGSDPYMVGPTLGAGALAVVNDGELIYPTTYQKYNILDNGPLRFTLELEFAPRAFGIDTAVVEKRMITLDYGSQLNKTSVRYFGFSRTVDLAAGIVVHENHPTTYEGDAQSGYIAYEDLTSDANAGDGSIYIGVCRPDGFASVSYQQLDEPRAGAVGHMLAVQPYRPFAVHTYYWGFGWSKYGFDSQEAWKNYMMQYMERLRQPLLYKW